MIKTIQWLSILAFLDNLQITVLHVFYGVKSWKWGSEHKWKLDSHACTCFLIHEKEQTCPLTTSLVAYVPAIELWCTAFTLSRGPLPIKFSPSGTSTTSPLRSFTKDWGIVTTCIIWCHTGSLVPRLPVSLGSRLTSLCKDKRKSHLLRLHYIFPTFYIRSLCSCCHKPRPLCYRSICFLLATPRRFSERSQRDWLVPDPRGISGRARPLSLALIWYSSTLLGVRWSTRVATQMLDHV